jgi:hypothetical protein
LRAESGGESRGTNSNLNYFNGVFQTTGSSPGLVGAVTVTISYLPDNAQQPDAVFGVPDTAPDWTTVTYTQVSNASNSASPGALTNTSTGLTANFLLYTSTATDTVDASASADTQDSNVLEIDLLQMYAALGLDPKYYYSIYIGCNPVQPPNGANNNYPGIVIKDADDLTGATAAFAGTPPGPFTNGLSIVSTQRMYITGGGNAIQQPGLTASGFNTVPWPHPPDPNNPYPSTSIYAPDLRYGMSDLVPTIAVKGQVSVSQATANSATAINPLSFSTGANAQISGAGNSFSLNAVSTPRSVPPITRLNLLFTIEKERTN